MVKLFTFLEWFIMDIFDIYQRNGTYVLPHCVFVVRYEYLNMSLKAVSSECHWSWNTGRALTVKQTQQKMTTPD